MTATPSKINGYGARDMQERIAFANDVVSRLGDLCGGNVPDIFGCLHAMQLMVLSAVHKGNHEAMANHLELMMPKLVESIRDAPQPDPQPFVDVLH